MPEGLEAGLRKNLQIQAFLKSRYEKKRSALPSVVLSTLTYEEMDRQCNNGPENIFLASAIELGFNKKKSYPWGMGRKTLSIREQAEDYINFLFDFNNSLHNALTALLKTPKDHTEYNNYIKQNGKWPKPKKNYEEQVKALYKYVYYLSE